jgi:hypothetical protein
MVTTLEMSCHEEVSSMMGVLMGETCSTTEIHHQFKQHVWRWRNECSMSENDAVFENGQMDIHNHDCTARPSTSRTKVCAARVLRNWLMKTDEAQLEIYPLEWSCPSNYATLYVKEYPRWVSRMSERPTQKSTF